MSSRRPSRLAAHEMKVEHQLAEGNYQQQVEAGRAGGVAATEEKAAGQDGARAAGVGAIEAGGKEDVRAASMVAPMGVSQDAVEEEMAVARTGFRAGSWEVAVS